MSFPKDHWLHSAKVGDLHKKLGVEKGVKIPTKVLLKAARNEEAGEPKMGGAATAKEEKGEDYGSSKNAIKAAMGC